MEFKHSTIRFFFLNFLYCLVGPLLGITFSLLFFDQLNLESILPVLTGIIVGLVFFIPIFTFFLYARSKQKASDYDVKLTEHSLLAPSSLDMFGARKSINLDSAFTLRKVWYEYPFLTYKVRQKKQSVVLSSRSLDKSKVNQIICELEKRLASRQ